ncbi:OmpA family protein [Flavobacterium azooxidireducens]|uniref:OmpA family protein n=1 Tax=Flavobacterium azooxidireducens TaxID=1871076 RepID=A0ABY4KLZ2_9FLAO|nr:OmpA family protein [Flavobacterium azooxidireducens]UPQ80788.1 OmpA family protein [Flavobacterium azooxidireducens]
MKKLLTVLAFLIIIQFSFAQETTVGERVIKNAKDKTYGRGEQKGDETVDKTLNKVEEKITNLFKKKEKKKKETEQQQDSSEQSTDVNQESKPQSSSSKKPVKSNSKFDFEAGEKELYFDNFNRLSIGDFPAEFNTNASGEIVNVDGQSGKWLSMTKNGAFIPDNIKKLPENFTLEFEVGINADPTNNYPGLGLNFTTEPDNLMLERFFSKGISVIYLHPGAATCSVQIIPSSGSEINNEIKMPQWDTSQDNNFVKVSLWRQNGRLRVYVNEDKLVDMPRFFTESKAYDFAFFRSFFKECEVYLTNIRYAVAGADTRNKLITEGKFVTNGILFDVNSDNIKPESGTVLKEIATTLQENPTVRVKIIGHTDSDGADAANLSLSQKRAAAVKTALSSFYGIDGSRLETDGKGESQPLNKNATSAEKAQNRRVEFIKL